MIKIVLKIFFLLLFFEVTVYNQTNNDFPKLNLKDIENGKIAREIIFDGNALWGYIDGGADIYLEYGFNKMLLQEIEWRGINFKLEYYRMNDAGAAFGIYSVSRFNCMKDDTLTKFICLTRFQLQVAVGKYYITISNEKGSNESENLSLKLLSTILKKCYEQEFVLPDYFRDKKYANNIKSIKYFKGKLGLQNGFPAWIDLFDEFNNYEIFLLPIETETGYENISLIKFYDIKDLHRFSSNAEKKQLNSNYNINYLSKAEIIFIEKGRAKQ